jgi:hypothetical protein
MIGVIIIERIKEIRMKWKNINCHFLSLPKQYFGVGGRVALLYTYVGRYIRDQQPGLLLVGDGSRAMQEMILLLVNDELANREWL